MDRFCVFNGSIQRKHMKSALIITAWNEDNWAMEALKVHYKILVTSPFVGVKPHHMGVMTQNTVSAAKEKDVWSTGN